MTRNSKLSVVIPCYCAAETIGLVVDGITKTMEMVGTEYDYEIILVNDGSADGTTEVITQLAEVDAHIVAVDLSRNFGQHSALMAGYSMVTGDYIIGMDDDGEHDPCDMFRLLEELEKGEYDYVCANFQPVRQSFYKRAGSRINNWMATKFIGKPKDAIFSSYYVMRRYVMDEILKSSNPSPYIGGMIVAVTHRMGFVEITRHKRIAGRSGYHFRNSLALWVNGITAFSIKPLRIAMLMGIVFSAAGFIMGVCTVLRKLLNPGILAGYTSIIVVLLLVGGLILAVLGIIGEYIGRIYLLVNHIPQYAIRSVTRKKTVGMVEDGREDPLGV